MAVVVERPLAGYSSTTTTENSTKYQTDSSLVTAISSEKVDGDINILVDAVNTVASYDGGLGNTSLSTTLTNFAGRISTNEGAISALVADKLPDGDYGDITVSGTGTVFTIDADAITTAKILDANVTEAKLASDSVTTSKVADDAITADKLNDTGVTAGSYTLSSITVDAQGRITNASSGTPVANATETVAGVVQKATVSEVKAETSTGSTGAELFVTPEDMVQHHGVAKAHVTFDGTGTVSILESFNHSSVTDSGNGIYQPNMTVTMNSTTYNVQSSYKAYSTTSGYTPSIDIIDADTYEVRTGRLISSSNFNYQYIDAPFVACTVHGELA